MKVDFFYYTVFPKAIIICIIASFFYSNQVLSQSFNSKYLNQNDIVFASLRATKINVHFKSTITSFKQTQYLSSFSNSSITANYGKDILIPNYYLESSSRSSSQFWTVVGYTAIGMLVGVFMAWIDSDTFDNPNTYIWIGAGVGLSTGIIRAKNR